MFVLVQLTQITMAGLDLGRDHGEQPTVVLRGRAGLEVARFSSVPAVERVRFRADVDLVRAVTAAATIPKLRAFIAASGKIAATDTGGCKVTHDDLAAHVHCIVMDARWPETEVERLLGGAS